MLYAHSDVAMHLHIVWSTRRRRKWIGAGYDEWLRELLRDKLLEHGCEPIAIGNASDHVHVLTTLPSTMPIAELARALKGSSSHAWNLRFPLNRLYWQGYWARSVDASGIEILSRYIESQRSHHRRADEAPLASPWEQTWSPEFGT